MTTFDDLRIGQKFVLLNADGTRCETTPDVFTKSSITRAIANGPIGEIVIALNIAIEVVE